MCEAPAAPLTKGTNLLSAVPFTLAWPERKSRSSPDTYDDLSGETASIAGSGLRPVEPVICSADRCGRQADDKSLARVLDGGTVMPKRFVCWGTDDATLPDDLRSRREPPHDDLRARSI